LVRLEAARRHIDPGQRVPRYVRFVTEWPMSGTKIKKAILREMIAADLKDKGITRAPKISTAP
jgi:fatty-acyl-CoA synthase